MLLFYQNKVAKSPIAINVLMTLYKSIASFLNAPHVEVLPLEEIEEPKNDKIKEETVGDFDFDLVLKNLFHSDSPKEQIKKVKSVYEECAGK